MYRWRAGWLSWYADGLLTIWLFNHSFILSEDSACLSIFFLSIVIYKSPQYCLCLLPLAGNWWFMQLLRSQKMACLMRRWQRCKLTLHKHTANLPSCTTVITSTMCSCVTQGEKIIFEYFSDPEFIEQLIGFLSLEDRKGKDHFNPRRFCLFKVQFKFAASIDLAKLLQRSGTAQHLQPTAWIEHCRVEICVINCCDSSFSADSSHVSNERQWSVFSLVQQKGLGSFTLTESPCLRLIDRGYFVTMAMCSCRYYGLTLSSLSATPMRARSAACVRLLQD